MPRNGDELADLIIDFRRLSVFDDAIVDDCGHVHEEADEHVLPDEDRDLIIKALRAYGKKG